jgi:orotidine-5'-phosphate decarboxylase
VTGGWATRLGERIQRVGSHLCLGIDPEPGALPEGFSGDVRGAERFARLLLDSAAPAAAAVKPNLAFWEAFGSAGLAALERVRAAVPADLPVLIDAKRGDIGSTAQRHSVALFDNLGADAVTASPYLGSDALAPLLERSDRFVYVLCRTSNPGADELQGLGVTAGPDGEPPEPLYLRVARRARDWSRRWGTVGLVVGATAPDELRAVRAVAPELPFLVPGVGAQGGDLAAVLRDGVAREGIGGRSPGGLLLVNVSRAIATAAVGVPDPAEAVAAAARDWAARMRVLR